MSKPIADIDWLISSIEYSLIDIRSRTKIHTTYDINLQWLCAHVDTESILFINKLKQLKEAIIKDAKTTI